MYGPWVQIIVSYQEKVNIKHATLDVIILHKINY